MQRCLSDIRVTVAYWYMYIDGNPCLSMGHFTTWSSLKFHNSSFAIFNLVADRLLNHDSQKTLAKHVQVNSKHYACWWLCTVRGLDIYRHSGNRVWSPYIYGIDTGMVVGCRMTCTFTQRRDFLWHSTKLGHHWAGYKKRLHYLQSCEINTMS